MLSRTADTLFWTARYLERAENMARLLEVGARISLLPSVHGYRSEWDSLLQASGTAEGFARKYGEPVARNIESFLFFDRDNPSSVVSCLTQARENARIVRAALTTQVWDVLNTAFQEMKQLERTPRSELELTQLTEWVTRTAALVRGSIGATLLRNDGYDFLNLGYAMERADATARLIDVKYYVLLPRVEFVGSGLDNYQWMTLLRALSLHRAFHWSYAGDITARKIVDFLILNPENPRALRASVEAINTALGRLASRYGRQMDAQVRAEAMLAPLSETSVEGIFEEGMHEFLTGFITEIAALSHQVWEDYLTGDVR
ncbi:alpha-E domain-containing protein [Falsirhodobacter deserti]|uniref:alpha-E domain-containing protein n=1 Tax=Falsirhodobacter deserti TaxID=1365611 RepID=UPI000FE2E806|nr:alpha-E domain-containing protein [Falsirhodobacter deserti]